MRGLIQSSLKAAQAFHHRRPFDQTAVGIGKPAEAVLDAGEGRAGLHHVAESERFGQIHRQGGDDGDENADAHIARPKGAVTEFAVGQAEPVVADALETLFQTALLGLRAVVKRHLLGMVAHAQQGGAVVGFAVLALDIEVFEFAADKMRGQRAERGIGQRHPHQIAVYGKAAPAQLKGLHA